MNDDIKYEPTGKAHTAPQPEEPQAEPAWLKCDSIDALFARADAERRAAVEARQQRGHVWYDPHWLVIRMMGYYEVDLEECKHPKDLLDWIWHLTDSKVWFTPQVLADFLAEFKVACRPAHQSVQGRVGLGTVPCPSASRAGVAGRAGDISQARIAFMRSGAVSWHRRSGLDRPGHGRWEPQLSQIFC